MALTRRGLLFGVGDAHVYEAPEAAKDEGLGFAAQRERARAQVPGCAGSTRAFLAKCVGCQLCIRECRHHVLKVSERVDHLFKPELDFRLGWCPPECSRCGAVCPAGALKPVSEVEKRKAHLGVAQWHKENCLATKGVTCNACLRHCPAGAIRMERKSEKGKVKNRGEAVFMPVVDVAKCIGCGACEFFCPARPATGMQVEGKVNSEE